MTTSTPHPAAGPAAARRSLEGLSLGDAFGERWFPLFREPRRAFNEIKARRTPRSRSGTGPTTPRWLGP